MVVNSCFTYWYFSFDPHLQLELHGNLKQNQFPLDFLHTFTVILPSVTWTLDNSNLPLTWSNLFCFSSNPFYTVNLILQLHNSIHVLSWKNTVNCSLKHWISFKTTVLFLYFFVSPIHIQYLALYWLIKLCCLISFSKYQYYLLLPL